MSPRFFDAVGELAGFPRVSGDEPPIITSADQLNWFSPRERG